jgi:hypothetical protein
MVRTHSGEFALDIPEASAGHGGAPRPPPCGALASPPPPPPHVSIEQLLAMQNDLMLVLVENMGH